jgi:hypothetical protein
MNEPEDIQATLANATKAIAQITEAFKALAAAIGPCMEPIRQAMQAISEMPNVPILCGDTSYFGPSYPCVLAVGHNGKHTDRSGDSW